MKTNRILEKKLIELCFIFKIVVLYFLYKKTLKFNSFSLKKDAFFTKIQITEKIKKIPLHVHLKLFRSQKINRSKNFFSKEKEKWTIYLTVLSKQFLSILKSAMKIVRSFKVTKLFEEGLFYI